MWAGTANQQQEPGVILFPQTDLSNSLFGHTQALIRAVNRRQPRDFTRRLAANACLRSQGSGRVLKGANRVGAYLHRKIGLLEGASKFEMRALLGTLDPDNRRLCALIYEGAACTSAFSLVAREDHGIMAIDVFTEEDVLERAGRLHLPAEAVIGGGRIATI